MNSDDFWLSASTERGYNPSSPPSPVVLVTGGGGMVGRHLRPLLPHAVFVTHAMYDLTKEAEVARMFQRFKPAVVLHLAARVGGLLDNLKHGSDYLVQNVLMNTHVIDCAQRFGVKRLIAVGSTCIYPNQVDSYPMKEDQVMAGPPPIGNRGYAYAKRLMMVQIEECNKQHGTQYQTVMPCNLYGEYDHFEPQRSHVVTAMIRKFREAQGSTVTLLGDGTPLRQFMYAEDLARALKLLLDHPEDTCSYNIIPPDSNRSIRELAELVQTASAAASPASMSESTISFNDDTKMNGQYRKDADGSAFWTAYPEFRFTPILEGLTQTINHKYGENIGSHAGRGNPECSGNSCTGHH